MALFLSQAIDGFRQCAFQMTVAGIAAICHRKAWLGKVPINGAADKHDDVGPGGIVTGDLLQ
ncbi:MAG TPA: hypothetical protein DCE44_08600 [Verrucomicrobiales bacterium]|nr:hypothetical protein [Verrucomicrobiales bacterium]